jgi:hypothetical protein
MNKYLYIHLNMNVYINVYIYTGFDSTIFWGALYITPAFWGLLLLIGMLRLKFEYLPIVIASLAMSGANIIGYMKCSSSAKNKMQSMVEQGMKQGSMNALENSTLRNWIFNSLLAVTTANPNNGNNPSQHQGERRV